MDNTKSKYTLRSALVQLKEGIIDKNPTFVQVLGMCPTLATTTSVVNALGMGLATTAVLACSNLFISLLRKFIPKQVRIAAYIVIISGFVTAVEMLMKAFLPELNEALGVFIALIVVNCIILARAEAFASKNKPLPSFIDGIGMGLGFTMALSILAFVRELIGAGSVFGFKFIPQPAQLFIMPAGAFITLGCLIALVNHIKTRSAEAKARAAEVPSSVSVEDGAEVAQSESAKETEAVK